MDPVALLVTALTQALANLTEPVVKDAYEALKNLIKRKFDNRPEVQVAIEQYEQEPKSWEPALVSALKKAGAGNDPEVLAGLNVLKSALAKQSPPPAVAHYGLGDILTGQTIHKGDNIYGRQINQGKGSTYNEGGDK